MDRSILPALERAELAARERQLAAAAEADKVLERARTEARAIADGVDARITAAVAERRTALLGRAEAEATRINAEIEALGRPTSPASDPELRARIERAAEQIVARVLAETEE